MRMFWFTHEALPAAPRAVMEIDPAAPMVRESQSRSNPRQRFEAVSAALTVRAS
ncbi:hypothetical protein NNJEOMEG_03877 [Fundidesulfovibrio magnetotacticus]|uniref:Uncharacterized protein n=1 Tax=Fundidesulfovibrio magnetotacticus TaxID=2730080 RepID=A0A6V8LUC1_9BACT|nr:hypothetical protein NNJEOMEG_03877 [Fundidesulfovibrio magnetotacticus]